MRETRSRTPWWRVAIDNKVAFSRVGDDVVVRRVAPSALQFVRRARTSSTMVLRDIFWDGTHSSRARGRRGSRDGQRGRGVESGGVARCGEIPRMNPGTPAPRPQPSRRAPASILGRSRITFAPTLLARPKPSRSPTLGPHPPPTQIAAVEEHRVVGLGRAGDDAHASSRNERLSDTDILIEDVFGYPAPGCLHPIGFQWSPDGALLGNLFSPNGTLVRNLYAYDVRAESQRLLATPAREAYADESSLPREEKLRRERTRELGLGVTRFEWAQGRAMGEARRVLVPQSDGAYVLDVVDDDAGLGGGDAGLGGGGESAAASEPRLVVDSGDNGAAVLDARLSPDGRWVAFVRECEIRVAPCDRVDGDDRDEATDRDVASDALPSAR